MKEIVRVKLENEMDLILAHKRAMKLCELTGLSLIMQTSLATAVSEISRCAIEFGTNSFLTLGIDTVMGKKYLKAVIHDNTDFTPRCVEACSYAKRLVDDLEIVKNAKEVLIILKQQLNFSGTLTDAKVESFVDYFKREPPLSPYDELRRKNILLQDLAEKIKASENDYRVLTDSLPLMMFSVNSRGMITYTNKWLQDFLGAIPKELNSNAWQNFLYPGDYAPFVKDLTTSLSKHVALNGQYRFKEKSTGEFVWHLVSVIPMKNEKDVIQQWIGFIVDIHVQKTVEQTLKDNQELKETQTQLFQHQAELQNKVIELNRSNYELEQFAHLASHDLQEPLRKLFFYSDVLKKKYSASLDATAQSMLNNMGNAASRMKELIHDLLNYSQLQKQQLEFETVELNDILDDVVKDLDLTIKDKNARLEIDAMPTIRGNNLRLRQLFTNLISNSLKYCRQDVSPYIQVTLLPGDGNVIVRVKDNGIGFDDEYKEKIFGLFERLHTRQEFPGTGIGLSICKRIVELHHGKIAAYGKRDEFAVFEITFPTHVEQSIE